MLDPLLREVTWALRALRQQPGLTATAIVSVGLGVALTTIALSLLDTLLTASLPLPDPERLARVGLTRARNGFFAVSYPEFEELGDAAAREARLAGFQLAPFNVAVDGEVRRVWGEFVTPDYFDVLAVPMRLGRGIPHSGASATTLPSIVVSETFWRTALSADPGAVGRAVRLNAEAFAIAGVAAAPYTGGLPGIRADMWVPVTALPRLIVEGDDITDRESRFLMLLARLEPASTIASLQSVLDVVATRHDGTTTRQNIGYRALSAAGAHPLMANLATSFGTLLLALTLLVLLAACLNLASLLLADGVARAREFAVRLSLGATHSAVLRQLLLEHVLLAALAAGCGIAAAVVALSMIANWRPELAMPIVIDLRVSARVAILAVAAAIGTALVATALPMLRLSRIDPSRLLAADSLVATPVNRLRLHRLLLTAQLAVTLTLLAAAAIVGQGLLTLTRVDPGFVTKNVVLFAVNLESAGYSSERAFELWNTLLRELASTPGIAAVGVGLFEPMGGRSDSVALATDEMTKRDETWSIHYNVVSSGYFATLAVPILRGRDFRHEDVQHRTVLVNEALASRAWPHADPIGQSVHIGDATHEVVGVTATFKVRSPGEPATPMVFLPLTERSRRDAILHVRVSPQQTGSVEVARRVVQTQVPGAAIEVRTFDDVVGTVLAPLRVLGWLLATCGIGVLLMATVGIYGLVSYIASMRHRELAIRRAIGATSKEVVRAVIRPLVAAVITGAVFGVLLAALTSRLLATFFYGVAPFDVVSTIVAVGTLGVAIVAAALAGARRSLRSDLAAALRRS